MKKLTLLTGALLALTLAVAGGFSNPQAAWAICYCDPNEPYSATSQQWGFGTSCAAAEDDVRARTATLARQDCGATQTCLGNLVITSPCQWDGLRFRVTAYREYKCKVCEPIQQ